MVIDVEMPYLTSSPAVLITDSANKAFRHVDTLYKNLFTIYIVKEINASFTQKFL